jgi:hypothetical protein
MAGILAGTAVAFVSALLSYPDSPLCAFVEPKAAFPLTAQIASFSDSNVNV